MITGILTKLIDENILKNKEWDERDYIGASSIGNPCERSIWYRFHHAQEGEYYRRHP